MPITRNTQIVSHKCIMRFLNNYRLTTKPAKNMPSYFYSKLISQPNLSIEIIGGGLATDIAVIHFRLDNSLITIDEFLAHLNEDVLKHFVFNMDLIRSKPGMS